MNITLITTSFNDEVHGTFNDKKTGCGINLLKPENVTRYRRGGKMTDLGEVTCERCKTKIAKEMIKSDQKEMKAILKEERMKAKKGIEDEGIVPLGNTTAKITSAQNVHEPEPERVPEPPKPAFQPNGTPVLDNDLAKFAIKKPDEQPEAPSKNEFVPEPPKLFDDEPSVPAQPEPAPTPAVEEDDFLAQFAIQKPDESEVPTEEKEDDFLAQFAISAPHKEEPQQEEPETPPVLDDISAALAAMEQSPINSAPKAPEPTPEPAPAPNMADEDDIMKMFAIGAPPQSEEHDKIAIEEKDITPVKTEPAPVEEAPARDYSSEWDIIANQLFGGASEDAEAPVIEDISAPKLDNIAPVEAPKPPVLDDIADIKETAEAPKAPVIEEVSAPVLDDIAPVEAPKPPVLDDIADIKETAEAPKAPVIEDISAPVLDEIAPVEAPKAPALDDIADIKETAEAPKAPVIEDISAPVLDEIAPVEAPKAPVLDDIAPAKEAAEAPKAPVIEEVSEPEEKEDERPILEDIDDDDDDELELISESLEPKAPVLDNISDAISAMNIPAPTVSKPAPVQPAPVQTAPVIDDISAALSALNANTQPVGAVPVQSAPVSPVPVQPVPTVPAQPVAPAPVPMQPTAPIAGALSQVISVPQITGYNDKNQPIYTYVQMQIQGYDQNGQPILVPMPGQTIPVPTAPTTFNQTFNQNTRLRDAIAAAKEVPKSSKDMTPGQRIAAAEAAKGSPISANVSKIATNPHTRSTSQAFISAISVSKEYANQSLTETQGLKQRTGVLNSVEDVLSQLGDNSLKEKKLAEAKAQISIPAYQEYKAPTKTTSYSPKPAAPKAAPTPAPVNNRPLTKSELKAKKKQDKIDAKFQKEMSKRK
ncbi:MAG: hypothetical protein J6B75_05010 [Ruminococcus sp.]|nr:hypothetical protein [Ruminococcus sp.]